MGNPGEFFVSGFRFISDFDSGNLGRVEIVQKQGDEEFSATTPGVAGGMASSLAGVISEGPRPLPPHVANSQSDSAMGSLQSPLFIPPPPVALSSASGGTSMGRPSTSSTLQYRSAGIEVPEVEFQLWTKPDCHDTEFENGNRTWFFFGVEGGAPGTVLRFTVMNLNKQAKLFGQGMAPVYLPPGKSQWERYGNGHRSYDELSALPETTIFFHRETVIRSLEKRKMDLITLTGMNGLTREKETKLEHLFKEDQPTPSSTVKAQAVQTGANRPYKFRGKKTVFVSARVHPGETCSSHVINGFLKFLLRENDPRAAMLRRKYVFKLIPMLNPDGVVNGHYRTDTRGVNLNRVYGNPSLELNPTIYAARKLILYAHLGKDVNETKPDTETGVGTSNANITATTTEAAMNNLIFATTAAATGSVRTSSSSSLPSTAAAAADDNASFVWETPRPRRSRERTSSSSRNFSSFPNISPFKHEMNSQWYCSEMNDNSRFSEGDESIADFSIPGIPSTSRQLFPPVTSAASSQPSEAGLLFGGGAGASFMGCSTQQDYPNNRPRTSFLGAFINSTDGCEEVLPSMTGPQYSDMMKKTRSGSYSGSGSGSANNNGGDDSDSKVDFSPTFPVKHGESGLFLYIDIHGHASKRGIFMYGNYFDDPETRIDALLFPKLMSINSANFDFPACNFTQRNMYMKDRHTGAGREGSGRVSVYKATGLTYCYTLECNFNTGRFTNCLPVASRDLGRASPPPTFDVPPKYNPALYEDTGKSLAISILDLTESNPWTRLTCSSCKNLKGVRNWIRTYIKNADAEAASKLSTKSAVKASPIRNRLRNSGGVKKSAIKQLKLSTSKSPKSPETPRSLSKIPRKMFISKNSQCTPVKLVRQMSAAAAGSSTDITVSSGLPAPPSSKRNRPASSKVKKLKRPGSKTSPSASGKSRTKSLSSKSTSNSRSSSPRRHSSVSSVNVVNEEKLGGSKSGSAKNLAKRAGSAKKKSRGLPSSQSAPSLASSSSRGSSATPRLKKKLKKKKSLVS